MGQRMEEFRDQAEELVREMLEAGLSVRDVKAVLDDAFAGETELQEEPTMRQPTGQAFPVGSAFTPGNFGKADDDPTVIR